MKEFPSSSARRAPEPLAMKSGSPPTPLKARTGLLTPPGKRSFARACSRREASVFTSLLLAAQLALGVRAVSGELHVPVAVVAPGGLHQLAHGAAGDLLVQPPLVRSVHAAEDHVL